MSEECKTVVIKLKCLGFDENTVEEIVQYCEETGNLPCGGKFAELIDFIVNVLDEKAGLGTLRQPMILACCD